MSGAGLKVVNSRACSQPCDRPQCSCRDCEMARRRKEVSELIARMEEPPSVGRLLRRMGFGLRHLLVGAVACIGSTARWVSRRSEDDEWDPC